MNVKMILVVRMKTVLITKALFDVIVQLVMSRTTKISAKTKMNASLVVENFHKKILKFKTKFFKNNHMQSTF